MPHITAAEFEELLETVSTEEMVRKHIFGATPFVFQNDPQTFEQLKTHLHNRLGVKQENVCLVGSAQTGFSLSPDKYPRQFHINSDIDVLVVDAEMFDQIWLQVLRWHYPEKYSKMADQHWQWAVERQKEVYWGRFSITPFRYQGLHRPQSLAPIRVLATAWFNAFQSLSEYPAFASRKVSGRLYRTWDHALCYHAEGLRQIRDVIKHRNKQ